MNCFIIHLARAVERRANVERLVASMPGQAEIVDAVDGQNLDSADRDRYQRKLFEPAYPFELRLGEIGCFLSHRKLWALMLERGIDQALILEDDVAAEANLPAVVALAERHKATSPYIQLPVRPVRHEGEKLAEQDGVRLVRPPVPLLRTSGQIVSADAAAKLLAASDRFDRPVDVFLQMEWQTGVPLHAALPSGIRDIGGELGGSTIARPKSLPERLSREWKRWNYRRKVAGLVKASRARAVG